ncbi:MAG TPA: hypothetical protein VFG33_19515 [Kribbella sp.]|uniref:hypothetical protein n=1 Tax=Kribbella sp. TaxID=1871183 RepID=UPI002D77D7AD|nr:hypothetical protein [Kribbella sp.]HET6295586.1 hypothetical protein [Kribbella sp.]
MTHLRRTTVTTGLTVAALVLGSGPALAAPLDWTETPTGLKALLPSAIEYGSGALWTVGALDSEEGFRPIAARWDGTSWKTTPQPVDSGRLLDVAIDRAGRAWAVGFQQPGGPHAPSRLLVQQWNGRGWKVVPAPAFSDGDSREFVSVGTLGSQVWMLGSRVNADGATTFVYRYDGKKWTAVNDSVVGTPAYPWDIMPLARDNVWVAADDGIKHYDGRRWQAAELPGDTSEVDLLSLAANGPNDIWAVGHRDDPKLWRRPVAYHYDGLAWTEVNTPVESAGLTSVDLVNGRPVAVGETGTGGAYLLRLTGSGFVREADPAGAAFLSSSTVGGGRLWISGAGDGSGSTDSYVGFTRIR